MHKLQYGRRMMIEGVEENYGILYEDFSQAVDTEEDIEKY